MKKQIVKVEKIECVLSEKEIRLVKICLDYSYHRLTKHEFTGLRKMININDLNDLRKEL